MKINEIQTFQMSKLFGLYLGGEQGGGPGTIRNTLYYFGEYRHDHDAEGETSSGPFSYQSVQDPVDKVDHVGMDEDVNLSLVGMSGMVVIRSLEG